ncbi:branched-chain amino acid ABC transporter permease [Prauserella flavalba]|uniref:branched-chain amino acid ABC transporter permease n=1 Tax=Prauserella flavalba TaxID=1477506 RepID=UPI0036E124C0
MAPFVPTLVSGLTVGLLYGLFALVVVVLYRATGLINFAIGGLATISVFVVWELAGPRGWPMMVTILFAATLAAVVGSLAYAATMMIQGGSDSGNRIMRTLALLMLLQAVVQNRWGQGQPFTLKLAFLPSDLSVAGVRIPGGTLAAVLLAVAVVLGGVLVFDRTRLGLQFRAVADARDTAALLGVRTRLVAGVAWAGASLVAFGAGLLAAPSLMVSTYMFDGLMLFVFTAVICGGLTSLSGALVVGVLVGVVSKVVGVYVGPEFAVLAVFAALLVVLRFRPQGLFGRVAQERL